MQIKSKTLVACCVACAMGVLPGCYEETTPPQPQAQAPASPQQGPITEHMSQGGGSAVGGAKRSADRTVDKAQQESQRVADEADKLYD